MNNDTKKIVNKKIPLFEYIILIMVNINNDINDVVNIKVFPNFGRHI